MQPSEPESHLLQMFSQAVRNGTGQFVVLCHLLAIITQPSKPRIPLTPDVLAGRKEWVRTVCCYWPSS